MHLPEQWYRLLIFQPLAPTTHYTSARLDATFEHLQFQKSKPLIHPS